MLNAYKTKKNPHTSAKMNEVKRSGKVSVKKEEPVVEKYVNDSSDSSDSDSDDYEEIVIGENKSFVKTIEKAEKEVKAIKQPSKKPEPQAVEKEEEPVVEKVAQKPVKKKGKKNIVINKYYLNKEPTTQAPIQPPVEDVNKSRRVSYIGLNSSNFSHSANLRSRLIHF